MGCIATANMRTDMADMRYRTKWEKKEEAKKRREKKRRERKKKKYTGIKCAPEILVRSYIWPVLTTLTTIYDYDASKYVHITFRCSISYTIFFCVRVVLCVTFIRRHFRIKAEDKHRANMRKEYKLKIPFFAIHIWFVLNGPRATSPFLGRVAVFVRLLCECMFHRSSNYRDEMIHCRYSRKYLVISIA